MTFEPHLEEYQPDKDEGGSRKGTCQCSALSSYIPLDTCSIPEKCLAKYYLKKNLLINI